MYHKLYASFWHTGLNFNFASIISRSISSSILLESKVYFADYVSILWFDRSIKNVVRCISHCCFFIAFHTTYWNYRLILGLSMMRLIFFFLTYISLWILEKIILFAFFLHLGVTVVLTKYQKFGKCNNQLNVFVYVILIWWIIWPAPSRKGLKAKVKKPHLWKTPERDCSCQ